MGGPKAKQATGDLWFPVEMEVVGAQRGLGEENESWFNLCDGVTSPTNLARSTFSRRMPTRDSIEDSCSNL